MIGRRLNRSQKKQLSSSRPGVAAIDALERQGNPVCAISTVPLCLGLNCESGQATVSSDAESSISWREIQGRCGERIAPVRELFLIGIVAHFHTGNGFCVLLLYVRLWVKLVMKTWARSAGLLA
jgi:hypothetical protein